MSYIGSTPTTQSFIAGTDYFNGNGSTVNFTLSRSVNSVNDIEVIVNNVEQIPSGYSVSGTTLTFSAAPSAGTSNVYVRYLSTTNLSLAIPAGTSATFNTVTATNLTVTNDATINGVKVGEGGGSVATNTAFGASALNSNTTGATNVAVGAEALPANTTGSDNTAVGRRSGQFNTTGSQNTMLGLQAMALNTTGGSNTAVGVSALQSNTTGSGSVAVGYQAGYTSTTNGVVTAVGYQAAYTNNLNITAVGYQAAKASTGAANTAIGVQAFLNGSTGAYNTAIGETALLACTTGSNNTAVGYQAGYSNTTATRNTLVGQIAGYALTTGGANVVVGDNAFKAATTAENSVAIGTYALAGTTTGNFNTAVGGGAGEAITTGSKNTILGRYTGNQDSLDIRTESNNIVLSDGDGNVRMHYRGSDSSWKSLAIYNTTTGSGANMTVLSSGTIARSTSSLKYKRDVQDATHGLAEVLQLRPVTYKGKGENDGETVFGGLIAEEVHATGLTEFVQYAADGSPDALAYGNMVSLMVKAIQEQQALITALTTRIEMLENNNATQ